MKYRNASEILPDRLLKELQKYAPGEMIYVPSAKERKKWGTVTGTRQFYEKRNEDIRFKYFRQKASIDTLCNEYNLSYETIRKILYK